MKLAAGLQRHTTAAAISSGSPKRPMGSFMGPALGGWLTYDYSWRWVFYINLPVGVLCTLGTLIFIRQTGHVHREPFDFVGFLTLSLGIGALRHACARARARAVHAGARVCASLPRADRHRYP